VRFASEQTPEHDPVPGKQNACLGLDRRFAFCVRRRLLNGGPPACTICTTQARLRLTPQGSDDGAYAGESIRDGETHGRELGDGIVGGRFLERAEPDKLAQKRGPAGAQCLENPPAVLRERVFAVDRVGTKREPGGRVFARSGATTPPRP
jgi:hypothetical protein